MLWSTLWAVGKGADLGGCKVVYCGALDPAEPAGRETGGGSSRNASSGTLFGI